VPLNKYKIDYRKEWALDYSQYKQMEFRRKFFKIFAPAITVYDARNMAIIGYIRMKAMSLRSDIRLYSDKTMEHELVLIKARSVVGLNMFFDVSDSQTGRHLFTFQHRGLRSVLRRDRWILCDADGLAFGAINETSGILAIARRWLFLIPIIGEYLELALEFTPQTFQIISTNKPTGPAIIGRIVHRKNPFLVRMSLDTTMAEGAFDVRIGLAATTLLAVLDASKRR
jgi:hypothetical protein